MAAVNGDSVGVVGDYDLRGPDFDTALIGPVTETIIDADRLVRLDWSNGMPNWALYRTAMAGDKLHLAPLRRWCVAFAIAYCLVGGVQRRVYSDELACVAGWDALHVLMFGRELQPYTVTAEALEVHRDTYRRLRDGIYQRLKVSLDEYWIRLGAAYRHVVLYERRRN